MKPFVSIIIPTYQNCNRLRGALNSVLSQTYDDYEVLIMDDGSTDGTEEMVNSFKDSRIFYYWNKNSGGPAKPRNRGIKFSKGNWIAFLDSDDSWKPNKLKMCIENISEQVDLIYHDLEIVYGSKKIFRRKKARTRKLKKPVLIDLLINDNLICNSSVIVRKNLLQKVANDNASTYWNRGTNAVLIQLDEARKNLTKKEFEEVLKSSTGGYIERPMKED